MAEEQVTLSSPWETYYRKLVAMFSSDSEIAITMCGKTIQLLVSSVEKADALRRLLNSKVTFGNVRLDIVVTAEVPDTETLYNRAFCGNPLFVSYIGGNEMDVVDYCVFTKEVIQFFNDNLEDYFRNYNGLANEIAKEIIKEQYHVGFSIDQTE